MGARSIWTNKRGPLNPYADFLDPMAELADPWRGTPAERESERWPWLDELQARGPDELWEPEPDT